MTDLPALAHALRAALGATIGVGVSDPRARTAPLMAEEEPATTRMVPARRLEFAAGRAAARAAMAELGLPPHAVPMAPDRAPCWPAGLVGSISHTADTAVALVARAAEAPALGIDIEPDSDLPTDLWPEILTPAERDRVMDLPPHTRGRRAKEIFSAKEALHKLHHPLTGHILGFTEVSVTLEAGQIRARLPIKAPPLPDVITGHLLHSGGLIVTVFAPVRI